ncbi:MAG TPA: metallophosphoesterase family protein [Candidatus Dormibacteraeota bacterium]|nr:metallophosphoesterase family protein [Candidatus Dormibacteraeota bacterium]
MPRAADRVCVLSDVHGNVYALDAVLRDLAQQGCDALVVAGDLAAHGPTPVEAVDRLRELDALIIRGNTDRYLAESGAEPAGRDPEQADSLRWTRERLGDERLRYLRDLPPSARLDDWVVVHASPGDDERGLWPDTAEGELKAHCRDGALLCGHTHQPFDRRVPGGRVVNVGSVGWPLDGDPRPSYAVLERGPRSPGQDWQVSWRRVDYDRVRPVAELERLRVPWRHAVRHYIETATWRPPGPGEPA